MTAYGVLTRLTNAHPGDPLAAVRAYLPTGKHRGGPNAALVFTGLWLGTTTDTALADDAAAQKAHLDLVTHTAAAVDRAMLTHLHRRRANAATALADRSGLVARQITIRPMWRVVVGHGGENNYESGLTFSRTYGVPLWPGSALKGLAAAQAVDPDDEDRAEDTVLAEVFGSPRPDDPDLDARKGGVTVLDALPIEPPRLVVDVLTPHVTGYYQQINDKEPVTVAPAEYHNPVPVRFLAAANTPFRTLLIGEPAHVDRFHGYLARGLDERGVGGKTAAGYGYGTVEESA